MEQSDRRGYPHVTNSFSGNAASAFVLACSRTSMLHQASTVKRNGVTGGLLRKERQGQHTLHTILYLRTNGASASLHAGKRQFLPCMNDGGLLANVL